MSVKTFRSLLFLQVVALLLLGLTPTTPAGIRTSYEPRLLDTQKEIGNSEMDVYANAFGYQTGQIHGPNYEEGSMWSEGSRFNTPFDKLPATQFEIGDVIVVKFQENFRSQEDIRYENQTEGSLKLNMGKLWTEGLDQHVFGKTNGSIDYPGTNITGTDDYEGETRGKRQSRLDLEIACAVARIMPDGRLLIEGRTSSIIGRDKKTRIFTGLVHPDDVDPDLREVSSTRVSESQLRWEGVGPGENVAKPGLLNRIMDYIPLF
jgi:flagellar basal body L-ring protein FlgH